MGDNNLMLLAAYLTFCVLVPQQSAAPTYDFAKTWDSVAHAISTTFYARKTRKEEMSRLLERTKPLAVTARTMDEFGHTVTEMIRQFKDSHFDFYTKDDQGYYLMQNLVNQRSPESMPELGAWFKPAPIGYEVQMVLDGGAAAQAGVLKDDVALLVDGEPFAPIAPLRSKVGQDVTVELLRHGRRLNVKLHVSNEPAMQMFLEASRESSRVIEDGDRKIGYFHLWTQAGDGFKNALSDAVYGRLKNTDAFVLDLRDGFGGRPEGYSDPFFRPEAHLDWKTGGMTIHELFGYQRPLVVLINGGSRSAKEVLALILKESKRATLVGSTTAGNVLGTSPLRMNDWSYLEIPMVEVVVDGVTLEGHGVQPDVPVPAEFDEGGRDLFLQKALDLLRRVPKQRQIGSPARSSSVALGEGSNSQSPEAATSP